MKLNDNIVLKNDPDLTVFADLPAEVKAGGGYIFQILDLGRLQNFFKHKGPPLCFLRPIVSLSKVV